MKRAPTVGLFIAALLGACSSKPLSPTTDGAVADGRAAYVEVAGETDTAGSSPAACVENPQPRSGPRTVVTVMVELRYMGKAVVYGEPFTLPNGGTLLIGNFRFYASDFQMLAPGRMPVAVDVVAPDGNPVPYNVHLVNAEIASEMAFQISVPAGDYTGASFLFGINDECDNREPGASLPPLTYQSQMTWPRPFGFLFFRYEGSVMGATGPDAPLSAVAMGGLQGTIFAPRVNADGALHVASVPGNTVHLQVALDEIFKAVSLPLDPNVALVPAPPPGGTALGGPPGFDEIEAGEHLRQNANKLGIFSVTIGP